MSKKKRARSTIITINEGKTKVKFLARHGEWLAYRETETPWCFVIHEATEYSGAVYPITGFWDAEDAKAWAFIMSQIQKQHRDWLSGEFQKEQFQTWARFLFDRKGKTFYHTIDGSVTVELGKISAPVFPPEDHSRN